MLGTCNVEYVLNAPVLLQTMVRMELYLICMAAASAA